MSDIASERPVEPLGPASPVGGIVGVSVMQFAVMVVFLLRSKILALVLGPDMLGVMAVVDKLIRVFAQAAAFSLPFAALRYLPAAWSAGEAEFDALYRRMRNVIVAALLVATAVGLAGVLFEPGWFGDELEGRSTLLLAAFAALPALGLVPFVQSALAGRIAPGRAMTFVLADAAVLAAAAAVGRFWGGLHGIYLAYACAGSALALLGLAWTRRGIARGEGGRPFALSWPIWRFVLLMRPLSIAGPFAALFVHYQILADYGEGAAGIMQSALGLSLALGAVMGAANTVLHTPNVARAGTPEDRMHRAHEYHRVAVVLATAAAAPVLLFPQLVLTALYSSEFVSAAPYLGIFFAAQTAALVGHAYQALIIAHDRIGFHVVENIGVQLLVIVVAAWLIPRYGIVGAGAALLVEPIALVSATVLYLGREFGLGLPRRFLTLWGFVVVVYVSAWWVGVRWVGFAPGALALKAALLGAVATGAFSFLTRDERRTVLALPGRLGSALGLRAR